MSEHAKATDEARPAATEVPPAPTTAEAAHLQGDRAEAEATVGLVMDVMVPVTVELGRTELPIRDLLNLQVGSVVQLEKLAGEPVDIYVRDIRMATGDVVAVEDSFGVRIREILPPARGDASPQS